MKLNGETVFTTNNPAPADLNNTGAFLVFYGNQIAIIDNVESKYH